MPPSPAIVVITYRALAGKGSAARAALADLIALVVRHEPACLGTTLLQDPADDTRFLLYESWTDQAAYTGPHMQTPHIQAFIASAPALFAGPPDISFWRSAGGAAR
jgi:quinol monooxygenase YgiN